MYGTQLLDELQFFRLTAIKSVKTVVKYLSRIVLEILKSKKDSILIAIAFRQYETGSDN